MSLLRGIFDWLLTIIVFKINSHLPFDHLVIRITFNLNIMNIRNLDSRLKFSKVLQWWSASREILAIIWNQVNLLIKFTGGSYSQFSSDRILIRCKVHCTLLYTTVHCTGTALHCSVHTFSQLNLPTWYTYHGLENPGFRSCLIYNL